MSTGTRPATNSLRKKAPLFAALGDEVRLSLLNQLSDGTERSITQLTQDTTITRQGITKHLRILQDVGLVRSIRRGRESLFQLDPAPLKDAEASLALISQQWDAALARLKAFVEQDTDQS